MTRGWPSLTTVVWTRATPAGRAFDSLVQVLILVSIASYTLSTVPDLSASTVRVLDAIETVTVVLFSIEYVLRVATARRALRFVFGVAGLIDLAAILPFYLAVGLDLRFIRGFRLLRLLVLLKFVRYSQTLRRLQQAFCLVRGELALFGVFASLILFMSAAGIYHCENATQPEAFSSVLASLWWAVCTLTTVGYGDVYPVTAGGKAFTALVLFIGLGIVSVPSGLLASALTRASAGEDKEDGATGDDQGSLT
jgi:voltage-gated potassium channel